MSADRRIRAFFDLADRGLKSAEILFRDGQVEDAAYFAQQVVEFFQHELPLERSSLLRWCQRMDEERLQALLQESLAVAVKTEAMKPRDLARVVVDATVQPKNITFPTDAKLLNRAREKLVKLAKKLNVELRQSYRRVGKFALIKHQRYAHAKQFRRANRALRKLQRSKGGQFVAHVQTLPGNPYDGHTLAEVIPAMEQLIGNTIERLHVDAGYRGHNAPPDYRFKIYTARQKRRLTPQIKREMRRRSAVEPVIGHLKEDHRMDRNYLAHREGDAANAILAAAGYNFRRLLRWLKLLLRLFVHALSRQPQFLPA